MGVAMRAVEKRLREKIVELERQISEKDKDLAEYHRHFQKRFRWWIELLGKGGTPSLPWLIEDDAKLFHRVKSWWWW